MRYWWIERRREGAGIYLWLALIAVLLIAVARPAFGQSDRVFEELEKTDRVIERATEAVRESGSPHGKALLEQAVKLQGMAREVATGNHGVRALKLTQQAREKALAAIGATDFRDDSESEVRSQLDKTNQLLQNIRLEFGSTDSRVMQQSGRQLEIAVDLQRRALEFFNERKLRPALKLTLSAREKALVTLQSMLELHRQSGELASQLEQTLELLERARNEMNANQSEQNRRQFERAEEAFRRARLMATERNLRAAHEALRQSQQNLRKLYESFNQEVDSRDVAIALDEARSRWGDLEAMLQSGDYASEEKILAMADEQLRLAQQNLKRDRLRESLAQIRRALSIMDKLEEGLSH